MRAGIGRHDRIPVHQPKCSVASKYIIDTRSKRNVMRHAWRRIRDFSRTDPFRSAFGSRRPAQMRRAPLASLLHL
jgi:hypothetical protein